VHSIVKTRTVLLRHMLTKFVEEGMIDEYPVDIPYFIFKSRYPEVSHHFSESERLALVHIFGMVDSLNANFSIIRANWDTMSGDEVSSKENARKAIQITEGSYINARVLDTMISLLLRDRRKFDIRGAENAKAINRIPGEAEEEIRGFNRGPATPAEPPRE
jgi:hypothetical protein